MPYLDYYKMILDRVSPYPDLFVKEYQKAERQLQASEVGDLNQWINCRGFMNLLNQRAKQDTRELMEVEGRSNISGVTWKAVASAGLAFFYFQFCRITKTLCIYEHSD